MKKYFLPVLFLFITLGALFPAGAFAISNYSECKGDNEGQTKSKEQLSAERAYVNNLFTAQAQRYEELKVRKANLDAAKRNVDSVTGISDPDQSLVKKYNDELTVAQNAYNSLNKEIEDATKEIDKATAVCGANKADYDAAIKAMNDADAAASNVILGTVPAYYVPISPLPKDLIPGLYNGNGYNLSNLIGGGFTLAIIIGVLLSVVMIIKHSLGYILSADSFSAKKFSTDRITEIVTGLVILLCSVVILRTIDPKIVNLTLESVTGGDKQTNTNGTGQKTTPDTPTGTTPNGGGDIFGPNGITPQMTYGKKVGGLGQKIGGLGSTTTVIIKGGNSTTKQGGTSTTKSGGNTTAKQGSTSYVTPGVSFVAGNGSQNGNYGLDANGNPILFDPTLFCYQYRKKIDNSLLPRRCIVGFESCVLDKKQLEKTGLYTSFTQCKLKYSL